MQKCLHYLGVCIKQANLRDKENCLLQVGVLITWVSAEEGPLVVVIF